MIKTAATPKKPQVVKLDYYIDKTIYSDFVRICDRTRYAPKVIIEKLLKKFNENDGKI